MSILNNSIGNTNYMTNHEINVNGKIIYIRKYNNNKERFNESTKEWVQCCLFLDNCLFLDIVFYY